MVLYFPKLPSIYGMASSERLEILSGSILSFSLGGGVEPDLLGQKKTPPSLPGAFLQSNVCGPKLQRITAAASLAQEWLVWV